jgi:penicillin-binding protein 1A
MEKVVQKTPMEAFPTPEGIVFVKVDPKTGFAVKDSAKGTIYECFLENATPSEKTDAVNDEKEDLFR